MVKIENSDLELTKKGFLKLFNDFKLLGSTNQDAYYKTLNFCQDKGYYCRYTSFESFKVNVLYGKDLKCIEKV